MSFCNLDQALQGACVWDGSAKPLCLLRHAPANLPLLLCRGGEGRAGCPPVPRAGECRELLRQGPDGPPRGQVWERDVDAASLGRQGSSSTHVSFLHCLSLPLYPSPASLREERAKTARLERELAAATRPRSPPFRAPRPASERSAASASSASRRQTTSLAPRTQSLQGQLMRQCAELAKLRAALAAVESGEDGVLPLSRLREMLDRALRLQESTLSEVAAGEGGGPGEGRRVSVDEEVSLADDGSAGVGATAAAAVSVALAQSWAATARHATPSSAHASFTRANGGASPGNGRARFKLVAAVPRSRRKKVPGVRVFACVCFPGRSMGFHERRCSHESRGRLGWQEGAWRWSPASAGNMDSIATAIQPMTKRRLSKRPPRVASQDGGATQTTLTTKLSMLPTESSVALDSLADASRRFVRGSALVVFVRARLLDSCRMMRTPSWHVTPESLQGFSAPSSGDSHPSSIF